MRTIRNALLAPLPAVLCLPCLIILVWPPTMWLPYLPKIALIAILVYAPTFAMLLLLEHALKKISRFDGAHMFICITVLGFLGFYPFFWLFQGILFGTLESRISLHLLLATAPWAISTIVAMWVTMAVYCQLSGLRWSRASPAVVSA